MGRTTVVIPVRLREQVARRVRAAAMLAGESVSAWGREALARAADAALVAEGAGGPDGQAADDGS